VYKEKEESDEYTSKVVDIRSHTFIHIHSYTYMHTHIHTYTLTL
jgi:hypothetical protein